MATIRVDVDIDINVYSVSDDSGAEPEYSFDVDGDGDVTVEIKGVVIDADEFDLLERAKQLTDDDWDLIATSTLIDQ